MGLIELIGTLGANKMKCQAMLEQRRQVEKAYSQIGECAIKQIKAESSAIHYSSAVVEATTLIEQIGPLPMNKMKFQEMPRERDGRTWSRRTPSRTVAALARQRQRGPEGRRATRAERSSSSRSCEECTAG